MFTKILGLIIAIPIFLFLISANSLFVGLLVWPLWNWIIPPVLHLPEIGYFQAVGLSVLTSLLFKSASAKSSW